jgi:hypothetical protein
MLAVTDWAPDVAVAVTVADEPAGTFDKIASATPPALVWAGVVMKPDVAVNATLSPDTSCALASRAVARIDAAGSAPPPTELASVRVVATLVLDTTDAVVGAVVLPAQPTLVSATQHNVNRTDRTIAPTNLPARDLSALRC